MTDPTPAQARLLRALEEYKYTQIVWNGSQTRIKGPVGWQVKKQLEMDGVQVRSPTVRKLVQEGWLEPVVEGSYAYKISEAGRAAIKVLEPDDFRSPVPAMTAPEVHRALREGFYGDTWSYFVEVTMGGWQSERRIDALAFRLSAPHELHAIEVKVDRGDFLRELEEPSKRKPAEVLAHCFYFAAPAGLIADHELPDGCGLLEVHGSRSVVESVEPKYTRAERPTWGLFASLLKSLNRT